MLVKISPHQFLPNFGSVFSLNHLNVCINVTCLKDTYEQALIKAASSVVIKILCTITNSNLSLLISDKFMPESVGGNY